MAREIFMESENKMMFMSGFKAFDQQTCLIQKGNFGGPTQHSNHIRSRQHEVEKYHYRGCQSFDLQALEPYACGGFVRHINSRLPYRVHEYYRDDAYPEFNETILYLFHHRHRTPKGSNGAPSKLILDGWAITAASNHTLLEYGVTGPTFKSEAATKEAISYVVEPKIRLYRTESLSHTRSYDYQVYITRNWPLGQALSGCQMIESLVFESEPSMWSFLTLMDYKAFDIPEWSNPPKSFA